MKGKNMRGMKSGGREGKGMRKVYGKWLVNENEGEKKKKWKKQNG